MKKTIIMIMLIILSTSIYSQSKHETEILTALEETINKAKSYIDYIPISYRLKKWAIIINSLRSVMEKEDAYIIENYSYGFLYKLREYSKIVEKTFIVNIELTKNKEIKDILTEMTYQIQEDIATFEKFLKMYE